MATGAEKRKNLRRTVSYPAYIDMGEQEPARECSLCDASQDGAQLQVNEADSVPDEFILALSADGVARRKCRVAWRRDGMIGVTFLKDSKLPPRPVRLAFAPPTAPAASPPDTLDIDTLEKR